MITAFTLSLSLVLTPDRPVDLRAYVNEFRRAHGLPAVRPNAALQRAAVAHLQYMRANDTFGHAEDPRDDGYTGRSPDDRARAFGYRGANGEVLSESSLGIQSALAGLVAAPYHRAMFLQPLSPDFGAAAERDLVCVKFGGAQGDGAVVSPPDGATGVPSEWDGVETPDPLRSVSSQGPYGYPVMVALFGRDAQDLKLSSATLSDSLGRAVACVVLHPGNDRNAKGMVVLVPKRPLTPRQTYACTVALQSANGARTIQWSFQTAAKRPAAD